MISNYFSLDDSLQRLETYYGGKKTRYFYQKLKIIFSLTKKGKISIPKLFNVLVSQYSYFFKLRKSGKTPVVIDIELSNKCNERCVFCRNEKGNIFDINSKPDKDKFIEEKSYRLKFNINFPYVFKVVTNKKTKIYISYDDENGDRREECNIIAKKDSLLKYKKYNNIYFDLWSAKDVQIDIENNPISKYLGKDDVSVRGSFEPQNKLLYLKFYSH